ncbi:hypothetical protein [Bradyrhizobium sp. SZCCHNS1054]|uniref:hypothetical protein n=1 Tax=Bradyrhizobium sp. SZCCHNS1054 TaxID=3057301 RepID=UPI0029162080|nr:hypothetical protein [Bradyrhizobium sp. SZCCHNS1054]
MANLPRAAGLMMLDLAMQQISQHLRGSTATEDDIRLLRSGFDPHPLPDWLIIMLRENRLAGTYFSLDADIDKSKIGAEVLWFTPAQMVSEATECEPGISVVPHGYIPVGGCAEGAGDPYFLDLREVRDDPPLVRVPHDYAVQRPYPTERIELVSDRLSEFFSKAKLSGAM